MNRKQMSCCQHYELSEGTLSEGRALEYDVYVTTTDGVLCNLKGNPAVKQVGPDYLREAYSSKAAQDAHGKNSNVSAAFRIAKSVLADFKDPNQAVDIPCDVVTEGRVVSEEAFLANARL